MNNTLKREYFYYAKCLETGKVLDRQPDRICESASIIKLPILIYLLNQVEDGKLSLRQELKIKPRHHSKNGSGIMHLFYKTHSIPLHDLALMMIIVSDNIATNVLIELLGQDKINDFIQKMGLSNTKLLIPVLNFPDKQSVKDTRIGRTTPRETADLIERLKKGELLNPTNTRLAKKFMTCTTSTYFGRKLLTHHNSDTGIKITSFGNKTGACFYEIENQQVINDCGFYKTTDQKNCIFSVFSTGGTNKFMQFSNDSFPRLDFARFGKQIYQEL